MTSIAIQTSGDKLLMCSYAIWIISYMICTCSHLQPECNSRSHVAEHNHDAKKCRRVLLAHTFESERLWSDSKPRQLKEDMQSSSKQ